MKNIYRPPIANQGWAIDWSSYFRFAAPPSGSFRFRSVQKSWITRERWQPDEKRQQITNSKLGSVYQIVKLLLRHASPPSGGFHFRSVFTTSKIANSSSTVAAGREMYTEHQYQTGVSLANVKLLPPRSGT
jgi:hypothetical protein